MDCNEAIFEMGALFGRLRQMGLNQGVVNRKEELGMADYANSVKFALEGTGLSKETKDSIRVDIDSLIDMFNKYEEDVNISPEDAGTLLSVTAKWKRAIVDELVKLGEKKPQEEAPEEPGEKHPQEEEPQEEEKPKEEGQGGGEEGQGEDASEDDSGISGNEKDFLNKLDKKYSR